MHIRTLTRHAITITSAVIVLLGIAAISTPSRAAAPDVTDAAGLEFFENRIRPVLAQHCYECHNSVDKAKGGLALDYKAALMKGGESGDTIVPSTQASIEKPVWTCRSPNSA